MNLARILAHASIAISAPPSRKRRGDANHNHVELYHGNDGAGRSADLRGDLRRAGGDDLLPGEAMRFDKITEGIKDLAIFFLMLPIMAAMVFAGYAILLYIGPYADCFLLGTFFGWLIAESNKECKARRIIR